MFINGSLLDTMTYDVLIPDNVDQVAIDILVRTDGIAVNAPGKLPRDRFLADIVDADGIIVRSGVTVDAEAIAKAENLKVIARAGVGVDNIDLQAATDKGIVVMNTPNGNTIATAEHTFGLMLALARHIPQGHHSMQEGRWDRKLYMGVELRNKTLGIVGLGRIGRAVATRARAFEMNVIAFDPYVPRDIARTVGVELVELDDLYRQSDFITLHTVVTDETRHMINAQSLNKMKDGVRIVNAARGALIHDQDLADAIQSGKVAGAALDVYETEPPPADHPLVGLDNVIDTPHLAASTSDAQVTVAEEAAHLVADALLKQVYHNVVNQDVLKKLPK